MRRWRCIVHPPRDGSWNMAVDEALLDRYANPGGEDLPPTLRLYAWSPPAVSLGRQQPVPPSLSPGAVRSRGLDLVRRPTGGRAVLHEGEWTYAVVGRLGKEPFGAGVLDTYRRIAEALVAALERLGVRAVARDGGTDPGPRDPRPCFGVASAHEILLGTAKVIGSAQARRRRAFLQHGSIPFAAHGGRPEWPPRKTAGGSVLAEVTGGRPSDAVMREALATGFGERLEAEFEEGGLTDDEALHAAALRCWKYDSIAWTLDGILGERERRWGPTLRDRAG